MVDLLTKQRGNVLFNTPNTLSLMNSLYRHTALSSSGERINAWLTPAFD
ncbi:hypothetical protein O9992_19090 [Vibrio lentus]|nr:hypothetical protein [Vibrio lentus]